ncbi:CYTH and CHAD domain-containing protein [Ramlibacter albus]|uniref:CHAD domain-containing protein n=1 Tax=Ramlibacter albus TaxID=2079448 RepID=A0A923S3P6_9BURK|nr:CYTH and CHAD domain-containing protein [Ramlibacter albus]MBC5766641.1 CHAD domain-containing protein [Ramlibacter albus]
MGEFEIKLHVPADRLASLKAAVQRGGARRERLRARYFDTQDGALARQRIGLRLRQEGSDWVQTVKAEGDGLLHRTEHNVTLARGDAAEVRVERHHGSDAGDALARALRGTKDGALVEVYRTDIERTRRDLVAGTTTVEVALDVGAIRAGRRKADVCEIEFELKAGSREVAVELAQQWCERHGLWLDTASKAMRGERLARGLKLAPPAGFEAPRRLRKLRQHSAVRALAGAALRQVLGNGSEIARGAWDEEHVHQMRVGLRRLRTALHELEGLEALATPGDMAVLAAAFRALGAQRDAAHLQPKLLESMRADGAPPLELPPAASVAPDPQQVARDLRLQAVLLQLLGRLSATAPPREPGPGAVRRHIGQRLAALHRHVVKDGGRFEDLPHEEQHGLRKRFKRLRYLAEAAAGLYEARKVEAFTNALKPVQDALGEFQDEWVAAGFWRARAAGDPNAWFAVGWLQARRAAGVARCASACRRYAKHATPFWS